MLPPNAACSRLAFRFASSERLTLAGIVQQPGSFDQINSNHKYGFIVQQK
jgi:hypothetical protein